MRKGTFVILIAMVAILVLPAVLYAQETDPAALFTALADALNAGDVDAALALVADDAVLTFPDLGYVFTGKEEIRGWYEGLVAQNLHAEPSDFQIDGDRMTWSNKVSIDDWRALGIAPLDYTGEGTVQDGKIKSYTETMTPQSLAKLQAAMAQQLPETGAGRPTDARVALLLVIGGVLVAAFGLGLGLRRAFSRSR